MRTRQQHRRSSPAPRFRPAFTLIELLMVISIISLLIALLLPAVTSVVHKAKVAQVVSDIQGLANAADSFNAQYHVYPPSGTTDATNPKLVLCEKASDWATYPESRNLIRRIFGSEFDFTIDRDINGDMTKTDVIQLNGQQCLVFFLGGMPVKDMATGKFTVIGFSSNRRDPFDRIATSRTKFFTSFDPNRLSDGGQGMPVYHDIFNAPGVGPGYAYISTTNAQNAYISSHLPMGMTSFYHQGSASSPWKPDGFQIISAGPDNTFGTGGAYDEQNAGGLLTGGRTAERDNITNFSKGKLAD
jgi:prepilin-type N-terminal cleavage/methylation domain-containing protein